MDSLIRELKFTLKDRVVLVTLIAVALLSSFSVVNGIKESNSEKATIKRVTNLVNEDRQYNLAKQTDAGGAAYYAFHFTYDAPSSLAFVARGVRDDLPWKHRIRMLALEGQIYETDSGNPELSKIGKLDFAFVAAFLLPLLSILLLYDLRAVEVRNSRWEFLSVININGREILRQRAALRSLLILLAALVPFITAALINNAGFWGILLITFAVAINLIFWCLIALGVLTRIESGPTTATLLLGCWLVFAVVIPVGGKLIVEQIISVPDGGEILLSQREAVNDAWDLPKEATMAPFLDRHPQWKDTAKVTRPFEWKWYYAFQQVGDQHVEALSTQLRSGIYRRDKAMQSMSLLSPLLLTKRLITRAANTDMTEFQRYDKCVRAFHLSLREFHYPMLFGGVEYTAEKMQSLPEFTDCRGQG